MKFDLNLTEADVSALSSADAVAAFFSRLGYNTNVRTIQTVGNLGFSESVAKPIKKLELIADQETLFQVYLVEVQSVRIDHIRNLVRAFRNRSGNYLFVLTSDYDRIDFVLLERYEPSTGVSTRIAGQENIGVRPLTLTVNRRKPRKIDLRVLRRLTYTEGDPFAQYDKLRAAYSIAHWSEEHFNNRALFSDYYLLRRLQERPEWAEDPKPTYRTLHEQFQSAAVKLHQSSDDAIRKELAEPVLQQLGFTIKTRIREGHEGSDYELYGLSHTEKPLAVALVYPWARNLDGKDSERDTITPEENPGAVVVSLLEQGVAPWAMVTNGKIWRLYCQRTHSRATNYYEVNLEEILAPDQFSESDLKDSFRYFWLLFRCQSFVPAEMTYAGKAQTLSFLDLLLAESADYAKALGERLKESVFVQVFPYLAEGFIAYKKQTDGKEADLSEEALDSIYQGTLTLLYRLLFLLYAEARDLLPVKEIRGYYENSVAKLKSEIADVVGTVEDEREGKLGRKFTKSSTEFYDRLVELFHAVDRGNTSLNVPMYNGGLFLTEPDDDEESPEAINATFLRDHKVPDFFLACAVDKLARDIDPKSQGLVMIDYKDLGVRQLGSIYEGLLEFKLRIATKKLGVQGSKKREVYVPWSELDDRQQAKAEKAGKLVKKGSPYLENDKQERKATGSYYTPDYIVKYIVENTVGPVLNKKFDEMRPKLRAAQQEYREFLKRRQAFLEKKMTPPPLSQANNIGEKLVDELFDIKALDPAMGSGHFLVEVVDFVTDKTLDFLNAFPWNPIVAHLGQMRKTILEEMEAQGINIDSQKLTDVNLLKRYVLKRCVYGVDLNPMAVELAKVSLWLDCFTLGAPLSFLDHHLRCGNSLIGASVQQVIDALEWKVSQTGNMFEDDFARELMLATQSMIEVGELSDVTSAQVVESKKKYSGASDTLAPYKRLLDVYTSQWFGNEKTATVVRGKGKNKSEEKVNIAVAFLKSSDLKKWMHKPYSTPLEFSEKTVAEVAMQAALDNRFFHWELEFPEVYYTRIGEGGKAEQLNRRKNPGFDAVVGNPPYVRQEGLGDIKTYFEAQYSQIYRGTADIYVYFYGRGHHVLREAGRFGMITSNKYMRSDYGQPLRQFLRDSVKLEEIIDFGELPVFDEAATFPCVVLFRHSEPQFPVKFTQVKDIAPREPAQLKEVITASKEAILGREGFEGGNWSLGSSVEVAILRKMEAAGIPLKDYLEKTGSIMRRGVLTGYNDAFVIDNETKEALIDQDPKSSDFIKALIVGDDVRRYRVNYRDRYLILIPKGWTLQHMTQSSDPKDWFKRKYPALWSHLAPYKEAAMERQDQGDFWWELRACDYYRDFDKQKIVYPEIAKSSRFHMDQKKYYPLKTVFSIPTKSWDLLAIFNSTAGFWYLARICSVLGDADAGGRLTMQAIYTEQLPIPSMERSTRDQLASLAEQRTKIESKLPAQSTRGKKAPSAAVPPEIKAIDEQIDHIVYNLYGLTQEEIAVIDAQRAQV
jgi:type I restriction-modification system DNA methylase subunit